MFTKTNMEERKKFMNVKPVKDASIKVIVVLKHLITGQST